MQTEGPVRKGICLQIKSFPTVAVLLPAGLTAFVLLSTQPFLSATRQSVLTWRSSTKLWLPIAAIFY